ncbi:MAG: Uma2 family endonuclease [Mycobacteriales bacterium]
MTVALTVPEFGEYPHLLTADDFLALDVDPKLHLELIDGELILTPSPMPWHNEVADELRNMIKPQLDKRFKVFTDLDIRLDDGRVMRPDVIVATRDAFVENRAHRAEDVRLVIEVVSPGSAFNDRRTKPILYKEAELEYWRIERKGDELVLYQDDDNASHGVHEGATRNDGIRLIVDLVELATWLT